MQEVNYRVIQGDNFQLSVTYKDPSGSPINLTGYSALFEVRDKPGGKILSASARYVPALVPNPEIIDGITIDQVNGKLDIDISSSKTKNFNLPKSAYQLQITNSSGTKTTLLSGWFDVQAGVIE